MLWSLAGVVLFSLAYHYPIWRWWPQVQDVEYANKLTRLRSHLRVQAKDQPLVLAFGSSFTCMGLRPDVLRGCQPNQPSGPLVYNCAMNSSGLVVQLVCLRRLLAEGVRPDCVLVEASPYFLFMQPNKVQDNEFLPHRRIQQQDLAVLARYHPDAKGLQKKWRTLQFWPWYSSRHTLQNWLLPSWVAPDKRVDNLWRHTDSWGWEAFPEFLKQCRGIYQSPKWIEDCKTFMDALNREPLSKEMQSALRELVETCQQAKVQVVLIRVPESSYVRNGYSESLKSEINACYSELSKATGVRVVDASAWVPDDQFVEGMHLTPEGAVTYTQRLEGEVLEPNGLSHRPGARQLAARH